MNYSFFERNIIIKFAVDKHSNPFLLTRTKGINMNLPRGLIYIIISIIFLSFIGCKRGHEAMKQLDVAETVINSNPDSAMRILESIQIEDLYSPHSKARYALLRTMALDKNYIDTTTFDILQPAIDYYIKNGTPDEKLKTYYYQGRIYQNRQENDSALQCYAYGKEYRNQISDSLTKPIF